MKKTTQNMLIGAGVGFGLGCVAGVLRIGAAFCPPVWPVADAIVVGSLVYQVSDENIGLTAIGATAGFIMGLGEVAVAPVSTALMLAQVPLCPLFGAALGAVIGHQQ